MRCAGTAVQVSLHPPPGGLVIHHQHLWEQADADVADVAAARGSFSASQLLLCQLLLILPFPIRIPSQRHQNIHLTSPPYCHISSSFIHPICISPAKHSPPTLHQAVNTHISCAVMCLISEPEQKCQLGEILTAGSSSRSAMDFLVEIQRKKISHFECNKAFTVFFTARELHIIISDLLYHYSIINLFALFVFKCINTLL